MARNMDHPDFILTHNSRMTSISEIILDNKDVYDVIAWISIGCSLIDSVVIYFSLRNFYGLGTTISIDRLSGRRAIFANLMHSFLGIIWILWFFIFYSPLMTTIVSIVSLIFALWRIWLSKKIKIRPWLISLSLMNLVSSIMNVVMTVEGLYAWYF